MATLQELEAALVKADAAGNVDDARAFANEIRRMRSSAGAPSPQRSSSSDRPGSLESFGAGLGAGFGRTVLGAQNYLGKGLEAVGLDSAGTWLQDDAQQGRERLSQEVQPYRDASPIAAGAGQLGGEIAATLPVGGLIAKGLTTGATALGAGRAVAPLAEAIGSAGLRSGGIGGARGLALKTAGGAATGGASAGLVDPNAAGAGAVIGGVLPGALRSVSEGASVAAKALRPDVGSLPLARRAVELGAPLGIADMSTNGLVRGARSILNDSFFAGGAGARQEAAKQAWFNQAVGRTFGANADSLTPEVMDAAKKRLGGEFDRIWGNNNIRVDDELLGRLSRLREEANLLPQGESNRLLSQINDIESKVAQGADGSMIIPGDVANRFQSSLRRTTDSAQGFLKENLNDLRQAVIGGFNRSVSPLEAEALRMTQNQYKAMKTVEPLLNKAETSVAGRTPGDVSPVLLSQAVVNSYKGGVANSPLTELSQIGQRFLVDRTPRTGGSARALLQNAAIGGAIGTGAFLNPVTLLAVPAGAALNRALGSPSLARGLLSAPSSTGGVLSGAGATGGLLDFGVRAAPLLSTSP